MSTRIFTSLRLLAGVVLLGAPLLAAAGHKDDPRTKNLHPLGHDEVPASLLTGAGGGNIHTDIAFWGRYAFKGTWLGFDIYNISAPGNPKLVSSTTCTGNQGDVVVWENILVRSWNSPAGVGATCDGQAVAFGFEGLHVFDISDFNDPVLVASVDLSTGAIPGRCGSHTATGVPDLDNDRLLIYNSGSQCDGIDIVEVPLGDPAAASWLSHKPAGRDCHDTSVILGDAMLAACAGDSGFTVWNLSDGGTLENPMFRYSQAVSGVGIGHSAAFTWDGEVLVFGHEPGGGIFANCQESNPAVDKSFFFFDAGSGAELGTWTLPRPQTDIENCTLHNFNVIPLRSSRYVMIHGSYQSGTSAVDFTDLANPVEIAYSDPPPIPPPGGPFCGGTGCEIGGAWSTYWYNNFMYESNITEGLNVFRLSDRVTGGALKLDHMNPQTQEFTIQPKRKKK